VSSGTDAPVRRIAWLLTPLVVWAASFLGAWIGALAATRIGGRWGGLGLMVGGALGLAGGAIVAWAAVLRRRPGPEPPDPEQKADHDG